MNTNYYPNYQNMNNNINSNDANNEMLDIEQSYIENILRLNKGKIATFYFSFPDSVEWRDRTFTGRIEAAGRDQVDGIYFWWCIYVLLTLMTI